MRATEKNKQKKHNWKNIFYLSKLTCFFFGMFFYLQKLPVACFFSEIGNNIMHALGRKKCFFLVMHGLNLMCALI